MKTPLIIAGGILAVVILATLALILHREPDLTEVKATAEHFVELYNQGKTRDIYEMCGSEVRNSITFERLDEHLKNMKSASGAIQIDREISNKLGAFRYDQFATATYAYYGSKSSGRLELNFRWDGGWTLIKFAVNTDR